MQLAMQQPNIKPVSWKENDKGPARKLESMIYKTYLGTELQRNGEFIKKNE